MITRGRWLVLLVLLVAMPTGAAHADPIRDGKHLLSCPDPSVVNAHVGRYRYYLACTSDRAASVFPLRGSNDLVHWHRLGFVFGKKHQPRWALHSPAGRYWAPALYRLDGRWILYFAAEHNPKRVLLRRGGRSVPANNMVLAVATARSLRGPWRSRILHYRGQFNAFSREQENYGGVIDPSIVRDDATGQLYLFWAEQHSSIWATTLSPDGLTMSPAIHQVLWTGSGQHVGWECRTQRETCVVEGPEEYCRDGYFYLFYSGASTWSGTYAIGVAASANPLLGQFQRLDSGPALRSGARYIGPGGSSAPITAPDGKTVIFYHAMTGPDPRHVSADRYLFSSPIDWAGLGGYDPVIGSGRAAIRRRTG